MVSTRRGATAYGDATRAGRVANDAGAYFALPLYAVQGLCAARVGPPHSARQGTHIPSETWWH